MESLTKRSSKGKKHLAREGTWRYDFKRNWQIYALFIPVAIYFITFHYAPMFGLAMAFERFKPTKGIFGSQWIWFDNFKDLFVGDTFLLVLRNTTAMAILNLTVGFAAPVILAMLLSEARIRRFSRKRRKKHLRTRGGIRDQPHGLLFSVKGHVRQLVLGAILFRIQKIVRHLEQQAQRIAEFAHPVGI